jgi:predicted HAD superfamily Cof-like phosphohydrolase
MTDSHPQDLASIALRNNLLNRPDWLLDIAMFHEKFGLAYMGRPRGLELPLILFRLKFMEEEMTEWHDNVTNLAHLLQGVEDGTWSVDETVIHKQLELCLDGLVDLLYVTLGTAYLQGFLPIIEEAWKRVHKANMSKVRKLRGEGTEQDSGRDHIYDVVKPADFIPPSHIDLVILNAHVDISDSVMYDDDIS